MIKNLKKWSHVVALSYSDQCYDNHTKARPLESSRPSLHNQIPSGKHLHGALSFQICNNDKMPTFNDTYSQIYICGFSINL